MQIGPYGLKFIEYFEGFRSHQYLDVGGVPTIGFGTTAGAGVIDPLPETCTIEQAVQWLKEYVDKSVVPSIEATGAGHYLNENQVDALCSLGYNLGAGIFNEDHTIGYDLRHNRGKVPNDFLLYEYDGTMRLAGLVTRREAERALYDRKMGAPNPIQ